MSLAACCDKGHTWEGEPKGTLGEIAGLQAYFAPKPTGLPLGSSNDKAILIYPDIWGWELRNTRLVADALAEHGYLTILPDWHHGDCWKGELGSPESMSRLMEWLAKYPTDKVLAESDAVLAELQQQHGVRKVAAVGFCWGGQFVTKLASTDKIAAGVVNHGSFIKEEDVRAVKQPLAFHCSVNDQQIPDDLRQKITDILSELPVASKVTVYPGMQHGFSLRGDNKDKKIAAAAADALQSAVFWFRSHTE